jgi:rhamnosyltransferase
MSTKSTIPRIFAIVVAYLPDSLLLAGLCQALAPQVTGAVIINNGCNLPLSDEYINEAGFSVKHLQANMGVATALNLGFEWAQSKGAEFVITFDQDSFPAENMVEQLMLAYQSLVASGQNVGAVGPQQVDRRTGHHAAFLAPINGLRRKVTPALGQAIRVDHLITSGCLVPIGAWVDTGKFFDPLFIDYVDIEWSLRMRHRGWHLFGVGGATLIHSMGDDVEQWGSRQIPMHDPMRHYFMFRNGVYLQKLPHVSIRWKVADALQLAKKFVLFSLVGYPRKAHMRAMLSGIRDGYFSRLGSPT